MTCNWTTYSICIRKQKTHLFQILTAEPPFESPPTPLGTPLPSPRVLTSVSSPNPLTHTIQSTTAETSNEANEAEGSGGNECEREADGGNLKYC